MKYGNTMFTKPEQSKLLIIEIKRRMKNNDEATERNRSEDAAPKKT